MTGFIVPDRQWCVTAGVANTICQVAYYGALSVGSVISVIPVRWISPLFVTVPECWFPRAAREGLRCSLKHHVWLLAAQFPSRSPGKLSNINPSPCGPIAIFYSGCR